MTECKVLLEGPIAPNVEAFELGVLINQIEWEITPESFKSDHPAVAPEPIRLKLKELAKRFSKPEYSSDLIAFAEYGTRLVGEYQSIAGIGTGFSDSSPSFVERIRKMPLPTTREFDEDPVDACRTHLANCVNYLDEYFRKIRSGLEAAASSAVIRAGRPSDYWESWYNLGMAVDRIARPVSSVIGLLNVRCMHGNNLSQLSNCPKS